MKANTTAKSVNLTTCLHCSSLISGSEGTCHICGAKVELRKPDSLNRTIALLLASIVFFIPANILPITVAHSLAGSQADTIFSGVVYLWQAGSLPIAVVVFTASILTPLFKIIALTYLCISVKRRSHKRTHFKAKLYEFTELIGRWSMIDVFVVSLLGALIQVGALASLNPGPGIYAFFIVVVVTIYAAESFDVRLLWDIHNEHHLVKNEQLTTEDKQNEH